MPAIDPTLKTTLADRYAIESIIGEGGMALVYRANDLKHGRVVALKVMRPDLASGVGSQRFLDEIRIAAQLNHPHIVALYDSGDAAGWLYYVMPFVDGESLRARLERDGPLAEADAVPIAREISDALAYAHRLGVVHRDIKPENILLFEGHATLTDFGIAKALSAAADARLTGTGLAIGTPAYMSPEQIAADRDIDGRADIYSLACVLYEMLTGSAPFAGPNAASMMAARFRSAVPTLDGRGTVSAAVARATARAMSVDPAERFASATQFADALHHTAVEPTASRKSIVVLPFTNLSADPENEYFSDGLTEEIISDLSKVKALHVISRTSAMMFKGRTETIPAAARRLGVRYALEGSVRKAGSSLRITAQLVDAAEDGQIWSEKYSGTTDDIFDVQERVSREIVRALGATLTADEDRRMSARPITDARVYDFYLRARQEMQRVSADGIARTESMLEAGLALAPGNPLLEAARGQLEIWRAKTATGLDVERMRQLEDRAIRLAAEHPTLGEPQFLLGAIALQRGDQYTAARHLRRAIELDPFPEWKLWLGFSYISAGQIAESKALGQQLVAVDPLWFNSWAHLAASQAFNGEFEASIAPAHQALVLESRAVLSRWLYAYILALNGRVKELETEAALLWDIDSGSPYTRQAVALAAALSEDTARAREILDGVGDIGLDAHLRFHLAESWIVAGEHTRGLQELEMAVEGFYPAEFIARINPLFEPVRGHAAFARIVASAERRAAEFRANVMSTPSASLRA